MYAVCMMLLQRRDLILDGLHLFECAGGKECLLLHSEHDGFAQECLADNCMRLVLAPLHFLVPHLDRLPATTLMRLVQTPQNRKA